MGFSRQAHWSGVPFPSPGDLPQPILLSLLHRQALDVTDLSDEWRRYIPGVKDVGGAIAFTANFTSAFKTAWETLVTAAETAAASSKATWFEIKVPSLGSFFFSGIPSDLGLTGMEVNAVVEIEAYVTPNQIHGWDTSST